MPLCHAMGRPSAVHTCDMLHVQSGLRQILRPTIETSVYDSKAQARRDTEYYDSSVQIGDLAQDLASFRGCAWQRDAI